MPTATRVLSRFQDLDDVTWTPPVDGAIPYYDQATGKMKTGGVRANAAQLIPGDGAAATPAVVGSTDLTSGIYFGLNAVNVSVGGALKAAFSASALTMSMPLAMGGNAIIGDAAVGGSLTLQSTSGIGTTDFIRFLVGSNGGTEAIRIIDSGYVGIGVAAPNEQLEIAGNLRLPVTTATTGIIKAGSTVFLHTYGTSNVFLGPRAGNFTLTGTSLLGIGADALGSVTSGGTNTAIGGNALTSLTSGSNNTAIGQAALYGLISVDSATAVGTSALRVSTGGLNTAIGHNALAQTSTGTENVSVGYLAGYANTSGAQNTFLGAQSGNVGSSANLTNATAIGYGAIVTASNAVILGNGANVGIGTSAPGAKLDITDAANTIGIRLTGYSLTGSSALPMVTQAGTLNTFGANFDVWKLAVTDTAHGAGVNALGIYGGAAGATALMTLDLTGALILASVAAALLFKTTTALITAVDGVGIAAFTLNMIGSTGGPTVAAQNGWEKGQDSAGNTIWRPIWK